MEHHNVSLTITEKQDYNVIMLSGNLEYGYIEDIKIELQKLVLHDELGYIIDLQNVTNIDSTGFGMIVNFAKKITTKNKKMVIIVVDEFIRNLFSISQVDKVFPIVKSENEAKAIMLSDWHGEISLSEY